MSRPLSMLTGMGRWGIDAGSGNYLATCSLCSWRDGPELTRGAAEALLDSHRAAAHPKQFQEQVRTARHRSRTAGR